MAFADLTRRMNPSTWFRPNPRRSRPAPKTLRFEPLEDRTVLNGLALTPLVQVSEPSPLGSFIPPGGQTFIGSEVEPQIAVDPSNAAHAVAVWQQDRYSGSGARALVASVTDNANAVGGATWSTPVAIPGFDGSNPSSVYQRYSDPWVSISPTGDVYASALAVSFSAGFPTRSAILVTKSTDGGLHWTTPTTLIDTEVPPGTDPIELLNDKEAVTADPTSPGYAYVIWDRLNQPSENENFNAFHGFGFRGDTLFARTTDGGQTWEPPQVLFAPQANEQWIGHQIVVMPNSSAHPGRLVDVFSLEQGSGSQGVKSARDKIAVIYSDDRGATWSQPVIVADQFDLSVSDPDTGTAVRAGETIPDIAVDPTNGNLYTVWCDSRFTKNFTHDDIALSMSSDGGLTWSEPIKVNQTPSDIPDGNQQAFLPSVAVAANGTVGVTYYDFRNNDSAPGLPTDYWISHADTAFTDPASWSAENRLTNASFNMESAVPTGRGYFLGDYAGLAATGDSFYALFAQPDGSDRASIFFRDPPPAQGVPTNLAYVPTDADPSAMQALTTALHVPSSPIVATTSSAPTTMTPDLTARITPTSSTSSVPMTQLIQSRTGPDARADHRAVDQVFEDESWIETIDDDLLSQLVRSV